MPKKTLNKLSSYFNLKKINIIIRVLTISDIMIISSFGLISPIFAIFITESIEGGTIAIAGISSGIYYITKSILQIPLGLLIDKIKGEKDDFLAMVIGSIVYSLVPILYILINTPFELYIVQFIYGIGAAISIPSWYAIFTRHIDKKLEGLEWGMYVTLVDLGTAGAAALSGILASTLGFAPLFITVSIISLIGSSFLLVVRKKLM